MKVLVTGHDGYIGSVMVPLLVAAGHQVTGLDNYLFEGCALGKDSSIGTVELAKDIRDVSVRDLSGFEAIIHLAALSNDPLGALNPACTYDINYRASVRLAKKAKAAGVPRFLFSSSCSLYGAAKDEMLKEDAAFNPITAYGISKVRVEQEVSKLADDSFSPTFLRNATAYGVSPRLRLDLVVNDFVGAAHTTGEILIKSDGTPWRPVVHVEDIARAFLAVLQGPRDKIHNEAFNVGRTDENYQVSELAAMVQGIVPGSRIEYAEGGGPDLRCYRVNCAKLAKTLPAFRPRWTVREGIRAIYSAYKRHGLTFDEFNGTRYIRLKHIRHLQLRGLLDANLRWTRPAGCRSAERNET